MARSLYPFQRAFPDKKGHPSPDNLSASLAFHSKLKCFLVTGSSYGRYHHTFFSAPIVTSSGVKLPFFVGCHSFANSGFVVARSLYPFQTSWFDKYGQPIPFGTRFRAMFSAQDTSIAVERVTGKTVINVSNPIPYAYVIFTPESDGFITISKDNAGTSNLKTYVFHLVDLIDGNN